MRLPEGMGLLAALAAQLSLPRPHVTAPGSDQHLREGRKGREGKGRKGGREENREGRERERALRAILSRNRLFGSQLGEPVKVIVYCYSSSRFRTANTARREATESCSDWPCALGSPVP